MRSSDIDSKEDERRFGIELSARKAIFEPAAVRVAVRGAPWRAPRNVGVRRWGGGARTFSAATSAGVFFADHMLEVLARGWMFVAEGFLQEVPVVSA